MRALFLLGAAMVMACGSSEASMSPEDTATEDSAGAEDSPCLGNGFPAGIDSGGRECAAVAGYCCYESNAEACEAAGCSENSGCQIAESYPTQVSCQ